MSKKTADVGHSRLALWRNTLILAILSGFAFACGSTRDTEETAKASEALSGTGGAKTTGGATTTGGTKATGTGGSKATTGGTKATGGATSTGGAKASSGATGTGGTKATGGSTATQCSPPDCNDNNPCTTDYCSAGSCVHTPLANGTGCTDGNSCTRTDTCQNGVCVGGSPVTCPALDACHTAGICNPSTGACSNPNAPDGTACTDNNPCTKPDSCRGGACVSGPQVVCTASDACHAAGYCDYNTGNCTNPNAPDGTICNDGNACTTTDTCVNGSCTGTNPKTCPASDSCHMPGTCDSGTGSCSNPNAPDGTICSDNNACTAPDQCTAGTCNSGAAVSMDDGNPCTTDSCDPKTGVSHTPIAGNPWCAASYNAGLKLEVLTNYCGQNQAQQFFQVTNTSSKPITLSDISIKFWLDDTSGADVVPMISTGGCATTAPTYPNCYHQAQAVSANATQFSGCASDATHRASWEVTVTNTDNAQLQPGEIWTNLQVSLHVGSNWSTFTPGTNQWYSPCLTASTYATDPHFAVYYQGQVDHSQSVSVPSCRTAGHGPLDFIRSPFAISASKDFVTGENHPSDITIANSVNITIPNRVWVRSGNAGNGQLELRYRNGSGSVDTCLYQGAASTSHPTTARDIALGLEYRFQSCTSGTTMGQQVQATWTNVTVLGGDPSATDPKVSVHFGLGGGCSDILDPDLSPYEVTMMREDFKWTDSNTLSVTDPLGNQALWHGLIYIDQKKQLAALDTMKIYWSALPLSYHYMTAWKGRCGIARPSTDGQGIVVYAIFPAAWFNYMRTFGVQAQVANIDPPFKFIIPSTPNEPAFANSDGSLTYQSLAQSGYLQWLQAHGAGSPWFGSDLWNDVKSVANWGADQVKDAYDWIKGAGGRALEDGFDYVASGFDAAVNWTANALNYGWEQIQVGLGDIVGIFSSEIKLTMDVRTQERDVIFNPGNGSIPFSRMWGPGDNKAYFGRPLEYPVGANMRVRQWGWGFLPIMHDVDIGGDGHAVLTATEGDSSRGGGVCLNLDTDYATLSAGLVPDEVCNFQTGDVYPNFTDDWAGEVWIDDAEVYALTQLRDASQYVKTNIASDPHHADVLVGSIANTMCNLANQGNPMTMCLNFPSAGQDLSLLGAALASLATGGLSDPLAWTSQVILAKDIYWPTDNVGVSGPIDSRGIMTHEYGHFTQCGLAYDEWGPHGLDGLATRPFRSSGTPQADREMMLETIADTFAMQVAGGSNYVHPKGSIDQITPWSAPNPAAMAWCTSSPCMDYNYADTTLSTTNQMDYQTGGKDANEIAFKQLLARYESIVQDAFDRSDSIGWFSYDGSTVSNGDVWQNLPSTPNTTPTKLTLAKSPFIADDDEPVSLTATDWKNWVHHWLKDHGTDPSKPFIMEGLVDTIRAKYNWCDACEVFAPHYPTTPEAARMVDPSDPKSSTRTFDIRTQRWDACMNDSEMSQFLGAGPQNHGNMLSDCAPCPALSHPNSDGTICQACPDGQVPRGRVGADDGSPCQPCPGGVAGQDNECHACGPNQITVNNVCTDCPDGQGADLASNTCKQCPIDATVSLSCDACGKSVSVSFNYAGTPNDICPDEFWLAMTGFDTCNSSQVFVEIDADPTNCTGGATGDLGVYSPGVLPALRDDPGVLQYHPKSCNSDHSYCFDAGCSNPNIGIPINPAGFTTLWAKASVLVGGKPVAGQVTISTPACPVQ
jgi:hypothetical protein